MQVVKARESMLQELKRRDVQTEELDQHQEDLTNEEEMNVTQQESKEGKENFGSKTSSLPLNSTVISNQAATSFFGNLRQAEEVSTVYHGTKEGTDPIESEPDKGRFSMPHLQNETEVDEWPDEEPSTKHQESAYPHSRLDTSNLDDEDVSFSDLEEDDSSDKVPRTSEAIPSSSKSTRSIVHDSAATIPFVAKETSSPMTQGDGTPRKSSEKGEFNDWFKVDQDDVASAGSTSP